MTLPAQAQSQRVMGAILGLTLVAFFAANWIGLPFWKIAALAACIAVIATAPMRVVCPKAVVRGIGWDVVLFMAGMFVIAVGLRNAGLTTFLQNALRTLGGASLSGLSVVEALL